MSMEYWMNSQVRSFLYLDEQRLLSLASQLLEGTVEGTTSELLTEHAKTDGQAGKIGSGRNKTLSFLTGERVLEHRLIRDHLFSLFEEQISGSLDGTVVAGQIVKVRGTIELNDYADVLETTRRFNVLGAALATLNPDVDHMSPEQVRESGLSFDESHLESLGTLLEFQYGGSFEAALTVDGVRYGAFLDDRCFRDDRRTVLRKFTRTPQATAVLVGTVINCGGAPNLAAEVKQSAATTIRGALRALSEKHGAFLDTFHALEHDEVSIDPLAVYFESCTQVEEG